MKNIKNVKFSSLLAIIALMWSVVGATPAASASGSNHHIKAALVAVGGSGVSGAR